MPQHLNDRAVTSIRYLLNYFFKGEVKHCYILYLGRELNHEHCLIYNFFLATTLTLKWYFCIKKACLPNLWCPLMTAWSEAFHPWESFSSVFALCWRKSWTMLICPSLAAVITADLESKVSCHTLQVHKNPDFTATSFENHLVPEIGGKITVFNWWEGNGFWIGFIRVKNIEI